MRRYITFILAALLIVPVLQSCEKSDSGQPEKSVLATVLPYWNEVGFACQLDNGETLYPGKLRINYQVNSEIAQRAIIYFSELSTPIQGFTYNADIFNIINITTKEIQPLKGGMEEAATYDSAIKLNSIAISGNYINVEYSVMTDPSSLNPSVDVILFDPEQQEVEDGGLYPLTLAVKCTPAVTSSKGQITDCIASFYIGSYSLNRLGCSGYAVTYKDLESDKQEDKIYTLLPKQNN